MPDFNLGLDASGSFTRGQSIASQLIDNRLRREQQDQNFNIQNRQVVLQEQEAQQRIQQQQAFEALAQEYYKDPSKVGPLLFAKNPQAAAHIAENAQQQYASQYNTLTLLTKDTKAENKQAVYELLKPELQRQFPELEFGDKASTELMSSLKARASAIKAKMKTNLEFKDTAQGIVGFNPLTGETTSTGVASKPYASEGAGGGATGSLVRQVMQDNPGMTFTQALQLVQTGFRNNTRIDKNGNVEVIPGGLDVKTDTKQAEKLGTDLGEAQAKAQANLGQMEDNSYFLLNQIEQVRKHKGLRGAVGLKGGGALFGNIGSDKIVPGSEEADFVNRMGQIEGQAFLQAFDTLRGGGQITENEGKAATQARLRMSTATSEKEFDDAAQEFEDIVRTGLERQRRQARGEFGTQIKKEKSSSQFKEGQTATNPKTGQTLTFRGGKWQ